MRATTPRVHGTSERAPTSSVADFFPIDKEHELGDSRRVREQADMDEAAPREKQSDPVRRFENHRLGGFLSLWGLAAVGGTGAGVVTTPRRRRGRGRGHRRGGRQSGRRRGRGRRHRRRRRQSSRRRTVVVGPLAGEAAEQSSSQRSSSPAGEAGRAVVVPTVVVVTGGGGSRAVVVPTVVVVTGGGGGGVLERYSTAPCPAHAAVVEDLTVARRDVAHAADRLIPASINGELLGAASAGEMERLGFTRLSPTPLGTLELPPYQSLTNSGKFRTAPVRAAICAGEDVVCKRHGRDRWDLRNIHGLARV